MGGVFFLFRGGELNDKKITKIKYNKSLTWPPFDILSHNNQPKNVGVTEGGWDRPRDCARTLGSVMAMTSPLLRATTMTTTSMARMATSLMTMTNTL